MNHKGNTFLFNREFSLHQRTFSPGKLFFSIACFFISSINISAQVKTDTVPQDDPLQQQIENLSESIGSENADLSTLEENLKYYTDHPLNLNSATKEELQDLMLLDEIQIDNLLDHRARFGNMMSIYELQTIDGFDLATIYKILPYVRVNDYTTAGHFSFREMMKNGKSEIAIRDSRILETQKGFTPADSATLAANPNARYLGNPDHLYARYRFTYGNYVSASLISDKDAGEQFFRGTEKNGFDFYSAHLCVRNMGFVKTAVVGDYQASFGQGLVAWTGFAFGKTSAVMNTKRNSMGIRPYSSVDENKFLRGAATTLRFGKFESTAFFSMNKKDANILTSDTTGGKNIDILEVSSLQTTGLHTTPGEIADKNAITETIYGGNISFRGKKFNMGITAMHSQFDADLKRSLSLYNQFEFSSQSNNVIGADYEWSLRNFHFFGEEAISQNGGKAFINGVLISLDQRLAFTVHTRWFEKDFQNIYANTFSESTTIANEKGIYFGMQAKPAPRITISTYYDNFIFPWLHYQVNAPSHGTDYLGQINFTPDKKTDMYFRYRHRDKFINAGDKTVPIDYLIPLTQDDYRFNITYPLTSSFTLNNRVEFTQYFKTNAKAEKGFVIWQDVKYHHFGSKFSFTARYALFQTDSYNSAIYAFETDMPYTYSIPAYYYKGSRMYLLVDYDLSRKVEIYFRISQTYYNNQNVISAGSLTEIDKNTKTEAKVMVRVKF
ncbi:MAG: helix-hairpin-helix domain-containing protein [Bacteroidetes bacterium]|nr:helix-hairpin-helix domain-containing protein [Bacteroidota bacterium]